MYSVDVTKDLLLIYNTNSPASITIVNYYLQNRPMVGGGNVLGVGCATNETCLPNDFTNNFMAPVKAWLAANPTKRPQYVILFPDVPSIEFTNNIPGDYPWNLPQPVTRWPSVQRQLSGGLIASWSPFVSSINMNGYGGTNDCIAYINKLVYFETNYSAGKLIISAKAGAYGNTNYVIDNIRFDAPGYPIYQDFSSDGFIVSAATNSLYSAGVSTNQVLYSDGLEIYTNGAVQALPHPTGISNVAGYITWGQHSSLGGDYPFNGEVQWLGHSSWWLIRTEESFNGERYATGQGIFLKWYSSNAFGGTNYSNTPVGGVSYTDEPTASATDNSIYFGLWAAGKTLAICAWNSTPSPYIQTVGDPFITK